MIETSSTSNHLAGIVPVAGQPLSFNMPWHDCLMPIHEDYYAIEKAVNTLAKAGCNTIWVVLHKETQPLIKKKMGEWIYDPETIWKPPNVFFNKVEIPIYYVAINPRDRERRDSQAWSCLYGAKVASYVSMKISRWVVPKRFLVVSPYGVCDEDTIKDSRELLRGTQNIAFTSNGKTFLDNEHLPFTFSSEEYKICKDKFKDDYEYTGKSKLKTFNDIFNPIDLQTYNKVELGWHYNISDWSGYSKFVGSDHNKLCSKPKYMVTHKWWGFVKDK
jgi:hypothetical protein